jgi:hypothetical protein
MAGRRRSPSAPVIEINDQQLQKKIIRNDQQQVNGDGG